MHIPPRILRSLAMDVDPTLRHLSLKEEAREDRILKVAQYLIARFGRQAISFANLAIAIKIAPATLRRHFTDLDALLGELMRRHLKTISQAIGAVPRDAPNRPALQRAVYIAATRFPGGPTEAHAILLNCRAGLAEDVRSDIDAIRDQIAITLFGENPGGVLALLDCPHFGAAQIEAMLAACVSMQAAEPPPHTPAKPDPQPPPQPSPMPADRSRTGIARAPLRTLAPRNPPPAPKREPPLPEAEIRRLRTELGRLRREFQPAESTSFLQERSKELFQLRVTPPGQTRPLGDSAPPRAPGGIAASSSAAPP